MLRCPTCLSLLFDADAKRCPSCRSKLRRRSRPTGFAESDGTAERPLPLVERELQARIEAETALKFRQRRRAAKVARRIASLPSTVFDGDAVVSQVEAETSARASTTEAPPTVIDLPAEAMHDVTSRPAGTERPAEPVAEAEPIPEPEAIPEPEPIPEPVEVTVDPTAAPKRRSRLRARKARIAGVLADVEVESPTVEPAPVAEAVAPAVEMGAAAPEVIEPEVIEVIAPEVVVPEVVVPEVVVPEVVEPVVVEPEVVAPAEEPVVEPVPVGAANWQRSNSLWTDRVFNTTSRSRESETVSWPRSKPATRLVDITDVGADRVDSTAD